MRVLQVTIVHAPTAVQRVGCESGPQHNPVRTRIPRRYAEHEQRIRAVIAVRPRRTQRARHKRRRAQQARTLEEQAALLVYCFDNCLLISSVFISIGHRIYLLIADCVDAMDHTLRTQQ